MIREDRLDDAVVILGYSGMYDGTEHGVLSMWMEEPQPNAMVRYSLSKIGPYENESPVFSDVTNVVVWCETVIPGEKTVTNSVVVAIRKREVLLQSGSASKIYDGLPLRSEVVTVGGDGFSEGEGAVFDVTGVQTDVGESENLFTYSLIEGTKASNYTIRQKYGVLSVTNPPLQVLLEDALKDFGTVKPDGEDGWRIVLTNTVQGPLDLGDALGNVTIDLRGRELVGKEGAPGSVTLPGGAGCPAIRIATSANGMDTPTHLVVVDSVGGPGVRGGRGGDGSPGGRGGAGIEVASSARMGVLVSVGPGVTVRGGDGGRDLFGTGRGGDGGPGVDGTVERNDGTLAGGTGGGSASGCPGEGGPASSGDVGGGSGTLVQTALRVPSIPTKFWAGKLLSPDVPSSPRYVAGTVVAWGRVIGPYRLRSRIRGTIVGRMSKGLSPT